MKKFLAAIFIIPLIISCNNADKNKNITEANPQEEKIIIALLDSFNIAAANADFKTYFDFYADDAIFTGTDASERWQKKEYMLWAKPYFDKKTTWNFTALERHIYFDASGNLAWFDELLNTQMKICRGSGVLVKEGSNWKIKQYILSTTVPNELIDTVVKMKAAIEDKIISAKKK